LSNYSWFEPCGSWQFEQLSVTGVLVEEGAAILAWQV
jgi:hypothetical protein